MSYPKGQQKQAVSGYSVHDRPDTVYVEPEQVIKLKISFVYSFVCDRTQKLSQSCMEGYMKVAFEKGKGNAF